MSKWLIYFFGDLAFSLESTDLQKYCQVNNKNIKKILLHLKNMTEWHTYMKGSDQLKK